MVVVTGATGHLGTVLVRKLVEQGESVRYVARPTGGGRAVHDSGARRIEADLLDTDQLALAFAGASAVFHVAGRISIMPGYDPELYRVNLEGTRAVVAAAREAAVGRLVHVGSIEAFPLRRGPYPIVESHGFDPEQTVLEYGRTKALAMQLVVDAAADGLDAVVCCPTGFVGPPDYRLSPMGRLIVDFLNRRLFAYVDGGFDFVDVRDVADGVIGAWRSGQPGAVYLLSGRYVSVPDLIDLLERMSGIPKPRLRFRCTSLLPFMPLVEAYYALRGTPARFTSATLRLLSLGVRVDSSRARRELGFDPRPIEETLTDTVRWFVENGYVRGDLATASDETDTSDATT